MIECMIALCPALSHGAYGMLFWPLFLVHVEIWDVFALCVPLRLLSQAGQAKEMWVQCMLFMLIFVIPIFNLQFDFLVLLSSRSRIPWSFCFQSRISWLNCWRSQISRSLCPWSQISWSFSSRYHEFRGWFVHYRSRNSWSLCSWLRILWLTDLCYGFAGGDTVVQHSEQNQRFARMLFGQPSICRWQQQQQQ